MGRGHLKAHEKNVLPSEIGDIELYGITNQQDFRILLEEVLVSRWTRKTVDLALGFDNTQTVYLFTAFVRNG